MLRQFGSSIQEIDELMRTYEYNPFVCINNHLVPFSTLHHDQFYNVLFLSPSVTMG
jgi:hypothetical protein